MTSSVDPAPLRRRLLAEPAVVSALRRQVVAYAERRCRMDQNVLADVALCVSEAVTNVVQHAYRESSGMVDVVARCDHDHLVVEVSDTGSGGAAAAPQPTRHKHGLGIMRALADVRITDAAHGGTRIVARFQCDAPA